MADSDQRDWQRNDDKVKAMQDVLRHILAQDEVDHGKLSERCLDDSIFARQLFADVGKIEVPGDAKVAFLPSGDRKRSDGGSLLLEPPTDTASGMSDDELLNTYVLSAALPQPSSSMARAWLNRSDRAAAVVDVLRYLVAHPDERSQCVSDDQHARGLFTGSIGKIRPPEDVKIVFMPSGQIAMKEGGSLVLELPTTEFSEDAVIRANLRCCYVYW